MRHCQKVGAREKSVFWEREGNSFCSKALGLQKDGLGAPKEALSVPQDALLRLQDATTVVSDKLAVWPDQLAVASDSLRLTKDSSWPLSYAPSRSSGVRRLVSALRSGGLPTALEELLRWLPHGILQHPRSMLGEMSRSVGKPPGAESGDESSALRGCAFEEIGFQAGLWGGADLLGATTFLSSPWPRQECRVSLVRRSPSVSPVFGGGAQSS